MANSDKALRQPRRNDSQHGLSAIKIDFENNLSEYYDYLVKCLLRLTHDRSEAEAITQSALLQFLRRMDRKEWNVKINNMRAYLLKIAKNERNQRKLRAKDTISYDDEQTFKAVDSASARPDEHIIALEKRIYLEELLRRLPPSVLFSGLTEYEKQLFLLRRVEGMPISEIASIVNKDLEEARYDLHKIEARIRYRVRRFLDDANNEMLGAWKAIHDKRDRLAS